LSARLNKPMSQKDCRQAVSAEFNAFGMPVVSYGPSFAGP
jgi:hypothetical protein